MPQDKSARVAVEHEVEQSVEQDAPAAASPTGPVIGEIAEIDALGRASVVFPGNRIVATRARSALSPADVAAAGVESLLGASVMLVFEENDAARPVIIGVVSDRLPAAVPEAATQLDPEAPAYLDVDGRRLVLEGKEEVVLRCGKSTLVLRKDGKVLIRGTHVVSRSSGPNWIKGASVGLN